MYVRAPTFSATGRILAVLTAVITDERFQLTRSYSMNAVKVSARYSLLFY
jgi:hypothetical protein